MIFLAGRGVVRGKQCGGKHLLPGGFAGRGGEMQADLCCGSGTKKARLRQTTTAKTGDFPKVGLASVEATFIHKGKRFNKPKWTPGPSHRPSGGVNPG